MKKVYTCLVGDLFHAGHVNYLRQCSQLGDYLLVGICSDEDTQYYKRQTVMTLAERVTVIGACRYVDDVILSPPSIVTDEFINEHEIDLVVHADDSNESQLRHFYGAAMERGIYQSVPYTKGISTTEIIKRIRDRSDSEVARKTFLCSGSVPCGQSPGE